MKNILYILLILVIPCASSSNESITKLTDKDMIELLIFGELKDLNQIRTDKEKKLWLKIYQVPNREDNDCFPESHGICDYKYYLATSQFDDSPLINAYSLGVLGEVIEYNWQESQSIDTAIISITANKYSKEALNYNKSLVNQVAKYKVIATPNNMTLEKIE